MNNYLVVHGSFGSPFINWFKWFQNEVSKNDNQVIIPQFPVGLDYQNYDNWKKLLDYYRIHGLIKENTVFIGHSIGAIFIVKYLIEHPEMGFTNKIVLVSGFNNYTVDGGDYDKVNSSFFIDDISKVKELVNEIICIYGDNDPYVKLEELKRFASEISTKEVLISNGGHLNSEFGYDAFEELLKYIN